MSTKRNVQFFRNRTINGIYPTHQDAIEGAIQKFLVIAQDPGLLDGELVLYRYKLENIDEIHTIVGVVCKKDSTNYIEIIGNYDVLNKEIIDKADETLKNAKTYIDNLIQGLDTVVEGSDVNEQITVKILQTDGLINSVEVDTNFNFDDLMEQLNGEADIAYINNNIVTIKSGIIQSNGTISNNSNDDIILSPVAVTGKAENVSINNTNFTSNTVEGALNELNTKVNSVNNLNYTHSNVNTDNTTFKLYGTSQTNGQITENLDGTIIFNQPISNDNKAATMADVSSSYKAGTNVTFGTDNTINVPLGLLYDADTKEIHLTQGIADANVNIIDTIDATDFIKDGMLKSATLVDTDDKNNQGKFIKLEFNTDADPNQDGTKGDIIYLDVTTLVDTYVGDDYITVSNYTINHNEQNVDTLSVNTTTIEGIGEDNTTQHGDTLTFKVPSFKVDKAGHITFLENSTITMKLPELPIISTTTVVADNGITVTPTTTNNNTEYSVSVKLNENTNDMLTVDNNGLNMSSIWDCGEYS